MPTSRLKKPPLLIFTDNQYTKRMRLEKISLDETGCFSSLFLDYLAQTETLRPFYSEFPAVESIKPLIGQRAFPESRRTVLKKVLTAQYGALETSEAVRFNIDSLQSGKTFTITTGHQLNIFTGPLYFIYKIVTVVNACKALKAAYPEYHFVPVYWMASEDHDVAEISSFNLFGKKYVWETDQQGPVGRFNPHALHDLVHQLPEAVELFERAYLDFDTLADAVRFYVNALFGDEGVVIIDADNPELKAHFAPVIEQELFENTSNALVEKANEQLNALGYKSQAFSREINFFYMETGLRGRLVKEESGFKVLNTDKAFSPEEVKVLLREHPERFSPNVIMRPLYQETILPNLAYCGGPAEVAYWLQLKGVFDHYRVPFPALMPRNFSMIINKPNVRKLEKLQLSLADLFKATHQLKEEYLGQHGENGFGLEEERKEFARLFEKIKDKAANVDKSLVGFVGAEGAKGFRILEEISKRIKKAEEKTNETALSQIDGLKEKLFPGNSLQERHDNFLTFYLNHPDFIRELLDKFDAFDFRFHILLDEQ